MVFFACHNARSIVFFLLSNLLVRDFQTLHLLRWCLGQGCWTENWPARLAHGSDRYYDRLAVLAQSLSCSILFVDKERLRIRRNRVSVDARIHFEEQISCLNPVYLGDNIMWRF